MTQPWTILINYLRATQRLGMIPDWPVRQVYRYINKRLKKQVK